MIIIYENNILLCRNTSTFREIKYIKVSKVKFKYMCCILQVENTKVIL